MYSKRRHAVTIHQNIFCWIFGKSAFENFSNKFLCYMVYKYTPVLLLTSTGYFSPEAEAFFFFAFMAFLSLSIWLQYTMHVATPFMCFRAYSVHALISMHCNKTPWGFPFIIAFWVVIIFIIQCLMKTLKRKVSINYCTFVYLQLVV